MRNLLIIILFYLTSCDDKYYEPFSLDQYGHDYYPLEIGEVKWYKVDSIQYDLVAGNQPLRDSASFFIREEVVEKIQDFSGQEWFRILREKGPTEEGPWSIFDVVLRNRSSNQALVVENNLKQIALVFPILKGDTWKGNGFLVEDLNIIVRGEAIQILNDWKFEVLTVDRAEQVGDQNYDQVATIVQVDSENLIEKRFVSEKYAKGVGLVYREVFIADSFCKIIGTLEPCQGLNWLEKAGRGFFLKMTLVRHS